MYFDLRMFSCLYWKQEINTKKNKIKIVFFAVYTEIVTTALKVDKSLCGVVFMCNKALSNLNPCNRYKGKVYIWQTTPTWPYFPDLVVHSAALTLSPRPITRFTVETSAGTPAPQSNHPVLFSFHRPPSAAASSSCSVPRATTKTFQRWSIN